MKYKFIVFCLGLMLGLVNSVEAWTNYHMSFQNFSDFPITASMTGWSQRGIHALAYGCANGTFSLNTDSSAGGLTTKMSANLNDDAFCSITFKATNQSDNQYLFGGSGSISFTIVDPSTGSSYFQCKNNNVQNCNSDWATSYTACIYNDHVLIVQNLTDCQQPGVNTFNTTAGIVNLSHTNVNSTLSGCSVNSSSSNTLPGGGFTNGQITATNTVRYAANNSCNIAANVQGTIAPVVQDIMKSVNGGGSKNYNYGWQYNHGGPNNFIGNYSTASSNITPAQNFGSVCYQDDPNNPGNILTPLMATSPSQCFQQACNNNGTYVAYKYANKSSSNVISNPTSRKSYNLQPFQN